MSEQHNCGKHERRSMPHWFKIKNTAYWCDGKKRSSK